MCVCVPQEEALQHSPMLQALSREQGNVLATAVNERKKRKKKGKGWWDGEWWWWRGGVEVL